MRASRTSPFLLLALLVLTTRSGLAHSGVAVAPGELGGAWSSEPWMYLAVGVAALAYRQGLRALWARLGVGRGVSRRRSLAYVGGLLALAAALVSPLDALSGALFSAHMVQHLVLVLVAAPLLAAGAPLLVLAWALPPRGRGALRSAWRGSRGLRAGWRLLVNPAGAWLLHAVALWAWHVPPLYDLAVRRDAVHALEHASFLLTAVLFWWVVLPRGRRLRRTHGAGALYVFTFAMQSGVLGALLTLSTRSWYDAHRETTAVWGLSPLADQQLAGAIMWVPGSVPYLAAVATLIYLWLDEPDSPAGSDVRRSLPLPDPAVPRG